MKGTLFVSLLFPKMKRMVMVISTRRDITEFKKLIEGVHKKMTHQFSSLGKFEQNYTHFLGYILNLTANRNTIHYLTCFL